MLLPYCHIYVRHHDDDDAMLAAMMYLPHFFEMYATRSHDDVIFWDIYYDDVYLRIRIIARPQGCLMRNLMMAILVVPCAAGTVSLFGPY